MDSNFELPRPRYVLLCILRTGRAFGANIQHSQNAGKVSVHAVRTIMTPRFVTVDVTTLRVSRLCNDHELADSHAI